MQMLGVTAIGSHSHVGSQALGEVRHCLVDVFLWQLFPSSLQDDFQPISCLMLQLEFIVLEADHPRMHYLVRRGHFRSRDKDGGHTIRSAIAENPTLYEDFMAVCSIKPELLPIKTLKFYIAVIGIFALFLLL